MASTPEAVLEQLQQRKFAPVYFLQGDEPFYIDQISDCIEKNALSEADKGFNQVVMYGKDVDMATILGNARRFPMMAERTVVIVKEAQSVLDIEKENGQKMLETYLQNPLPSTILVFCYKLKMLDGRKSLSKTIDKKAVLVTTKKLYDNQIPTWISNYVKAKGYKIGPKATQMLSDYIGSDLSRIANEIDKILVNLGAGGTIDEDLVQRNVGISKEYNIFELQTAIIARNVLKANQIVQYFEANPKAAPAIPNITILFSFFSKVLLYQYLKSKQLATDSRSVGVSDYALKNIQQAAQGFSASQVRAMISYLRQADLQAKGIEGGNMNDGEVMKELVFRLLHPLAA